MTNVKIRAGWEMRINLTNQASEHCRWGLYRVDVEILVASSSSSFLSLILYTECNFYMTVLDDWCEQNEKGKGSTKNVDYIYFINVNFICKSFIFQKYLHFYKA